MKTSPNRFLPYLALISGILALSLSALFVRWADAPGVVTSFYRMALAATFLFPFWFIQPHEHRNPGLRWFIFPILGGLFTALDHAVWSTAIGQTRVANATLLNNMAPLWVALFALLIWREKMRSLFWVGLLLALTGVTFVLGDDLLHRPQLGAGDLLAMLSSVFYAAYFLTTQSGRSHWHTLAYIWIVDLVAAVILFGITMLSGQSLGTYPTTTILAFLGTALISQVVGYFSVGYALGHLPAAVVAPTMIAQPVFTALLAIPLIGESLVPAQYIGGLAVLVGIYLVNRQIRPVPPIT